MKKVSTVAAGQSRNFSRQTLTFGLDLGDRNSYYCVVNEGGELVLEQKIATSAKALQAAFGVMPRNHRPVLQKELSTKRRAGSICARDPPATSSPERQRCS